MFVDFLNKSAFGMPFSFYFSRPLILLRQFGAALSHLSPKKGDFQIL